jgi:hypothetical protein
MLVLKERLQEQLLHPPLIQQVSGFRVDGSNNNSSSSQQWEAHFRGRQLTGVQLSLPSPAHL